MADETRDFVMARLGAARSMAAVASEAIDNCLLTFVFPSEDKSGKERNEMLEAIADAAGDLSRSVELAQAAMEEITKDALAEEEPDPEELNTGEGDDGTPD